MGFFSPKSFFFFVILAAKLNCNINEKRIFRPLTNLYNFFCKKQFNFVVFVSTYRNGILNRCTVKKNKEKSFVIFISALIYNSLTLVQRRWTVQYFIHWKFWIDLPFLNRFFIKIFSTICAMTKECENLILSQKRTKNSMSLVAFYLIRHVHVNVL